MSTNWQCLESNPETLTEYIKNLEFDTNEFIFYDLYSTEEWARELIPKPVLGVLFIFECNEKSKVHKEKEYNMLSKSGQFVHPDLFFTKQFAENACGTVGIYHILSNLQDEFKALLSKESIVNRFKKENSNLTLEKRSLAFSECTEILNNHSKAVQKDSSDQFLESENHFISFVNFDNILYEMDGRKEFPINHGETSQNCFLDDVCKVAKQFIERDPDNSNFSLICLAKKCEN